MLLFTSVVFLGNVIKEMLVNFPVGTIFQDLLNRDFFCLRFSFAEHLVRNLVKFVS